MTHIHRTATRALPLAGLGVVLLTGSVGAQEGREHAQAVLCEAAAKVVAHVKDPRLLKEAYAFLSRCPHAATTFATVWATPPADPNALALLRAKSVNLADRRILNATLPIVQNAGAPEAIRRAALDVVLAQYTPNVAIGSATWADPEHWSLAYRADYFQEPGEQPITVADRQRIVDAFHQMSTADANTHWRQLATRIATDLPRFLRTP